MLNEQQFKGKWDEIKGGVRNLWGRLTDDELETTKGSLTSIAGLVEQKYGETKEEIREKLKKLMASFENSTDKGLDPDKASYNREPDAVRTTEVSQNQDISAGRAMRDQSTKVVDEKTFEAREKGIGGASYNGTANNTPTEDFDSSEIFDEEKIAKDRAYQSQVNKNDAGSDRIARH